MFFNGQGENVTPTTVDYIFHSLFGLFFFLFSVWMIAAIFSDRARSKFHWGKGSGGVPVSRLSIIMALPFCLYFPASLVVAAPYWLFFVCIALFLLGMAFDTLLRRN